MCGNAFGDWDVVKGHEGDVEYVRRDPAILAALPEVQTMIAEAVAKAQESCADHTSAIRKRGKS